MIRSVVFVALCCMAVAGYAAPLGCCDMPEPITSCDCACTLPQGALSVKYLWEEGRSAELLLDGHAAANPMAMTMRMSTQLVDVTYGIRDNLQLCTTVPYVDNRMDMTMMGMTSSTRVSGVGDVSALVKYRLNAAIGSAPIFALGGGVKCASGTSDARDVMGELLPPMLQAGSGTTDPLVGAWMSVKYLPWGFHGGVMYEFGEADGGTAFRNGNALMSNWTACYTASRRLALLTELNYSYMARDAVGGVTSANTGGATLAVTPGVQYTLTPTTELLAAYQLPCVAELNGSQLKPADTLILGVRELL